jgi:hypothetical protein
LSLDRDLATLAQTARIGAKPVAVAYMMAHYTPTAKPSVPILAVQAIGDGQTSPSLQRGYFDAVEGKDWRSLWTRSAGHCRFDPQMVVVAVNQMQTRLESGRWPQPGAQFVSHTPPPMLRPCIRSRACR